MPSAEPTTASRNNAPTTAATPALPSLIDPMPTDTANQSQLHRPTAPHLAPAGNASDIGQWQQPKRQRTRKPQLQTPSTTELGQQPQRSSSRSRKSKQTNKFAILDYVIHPTFTDDDLAPIEVALPAKPSKPPRRKYKDSKKVLTAQACDAFTHPREVRHPAQTLAHLSPAQLQGVLRSKEEKTRDGRDRLARQIALLRAARTNMTERNIMLDQQDDDLFINQVRARMAECTDPPDSSDAAPIDLLLSSLLDRDELRVRGALCFAWMDLVTRATLPYLFDTWPDPPLWNNTPLAWLQGNDEEVPCLRDESLAALAACPTLTKVWQYMAAQSTDLTSVINTAANQWKLFSNTQKRN